MHMCYFGINFVGPCGVYKYYLAFVLDFHLNYHVWSFDIYVSTSSKRLQPNIYNVTLSNSYLMKVIYKISVQYEACRRKVQKTVYFRYFKFQNGA